MKIFYLVLILSVGYLIAILSYSQYKYNRHDYDEMQELMRGRACRASFFAVITLCGIYYVYDIFALDNWLRISGEVLALVVLSVGIIVYDVYCIWYDAYFYVGADGNAKRLCKTNIFIMLMGGISLTLSDFSHMFQVKDGVLSFSSGRTAYLFIVIVYLVNSIMLFIKMLQEKRLKAMED